MKRINPKAKGRNRPASVVTCDKGPESIDEARAMSIRELLNPELQWGWVALEAIGGRVFWESYKRLKASPREWRHAGKVFRHIGIELQQGAINDRNHGIWKIFSELYPPFIEATRSNKIVFASCMAVILPRHWNYVDRHGLPFPLTSVF